MSELDELRAYKERTDNLLNEAADKGFERAEKINTLVDEISMLRDENRGLKKRLHKIYQIVDGHLTGLDGSPLVEDSNDDS